MTYIDKICEVCNKKHNEVFVTSGVGPMSFAYCKDCLHNGYEPYSSLVGYICTINPNPDTNWYDGVLVDSFVELLEINLKFHNKTKKEFVNDCKKLMDDYINYMSDEYQKEEGGNFGIS